MKRLLKLFPLCVVVVGAIAVPSPTATAALLCPVDTSNTILFTEDLLPAITGGVILHDLCDLTGKVLFDHGVGALVPQPGNGVYAEGHEKSPSLAPGQVLGVGQEFGIEVDATTQDVKLRHVGDDSLVGTGIIPSVAGSFNKAAPRSSGASSTPPPACKDESKRLEGFKEKNTLRWKLNTGVIPGRYNKDAVAGAIKKGAHNVDQLNNNCSLSASAAIPISYDGLTGKRSNLDSHGNCTTINNYSTVDFGSIPVAARTCSWYVIKDGRDNLVESDIRFDTDQPFTATPGSGGCSAKLDFQGTATHEFGHAVGLAHVGTDHKNLTMTARLPVCSQGPRTLGLGDVNGLKGLY
jgi:hypothetical protein